MENKPLNISTEEIVDLMNIWMPPYGKGKTEKTPTTSQETDELTKLLIKWQPKIGEDKQNE